MKSKLCRLDRFELLILDDIGYVQQSRDEMEVLFTLLAERYERRSRHRPGRPPQHYSRIWAWLISKRIDLYK